MATDANGGPATIRLIDKEAERNDDLRELERLRQDDMREQGASSQAKLDTEREAHRRELTNQETLRINAERVTESGRVDALFTAAATAVNTASIEAKATAVALAERVDSSAKTLAEQVRSSAEVLAKQLLDATAANNLRLEPLERAILTIGALKLESQVNRTQSNWSTGQVIAVCLTVAAVAASVALAMVR